MGTLMHIDLFFLIPIAVIAIIVAIIMLIKRRKKNGVRPRHARAYLITALLLFLYAFIVMIVIPIIDFIVVSSKFGMALIYSGFKALG